MTMLERAARALCEHDRCDWMDSDPQRTNYINRALAVLQAMREPTREMLNAAIDVDSFKLGDISPLGFRCSPQQLFERCYQAMIDAALSEIGGE